MQAQSPSTKADRKSGPLGVCAAIGADFGFNPEILRIALAAGLLWNPLAMLGLYSFGALLMLAGRALFPVAEAKPESVAANVERLPAVAEKRLAFAPPPKERLAA